MALNKRKNPDYRRVDGSIPRELQSQFKKILVDLEVDMNIGIERAIRMYIANLPEGDPSVDEKPSTRLLRYLLKGMRPPSYLVVDTAKEMEIEEEAIERLLTLLFGEQHDDIIE